MSHRSSSVNIGKPTIVAPAVQWGNIPTPEDWLKNQPSDSWKAFFDENGYLVVKDLLSSVEVKHYSDLYDKMLSGEINTSYHRHDLGNHVVQKTQNENICQIMWPTAYVDQLAKGPLHERAKVVARIILGDDMEHDFDMLISKAPGSDTITPWHQDQSYWPDMPDTRAVSFWCAIDDADVDNGCMWFVPGCHKLPLRDHKPVAEGVHVRHCEGSEAEGHPQPLKAGSATLHHGKMLHYTRGNSTERNRRAFIVNFRPKAMVEYERQQGYDHGKEAGVHNILKTGQSYIEEES